MDRGTVSSASAAASRGALEPVCLALFQQNPKGDPFGCANAKQGRYDMLGCAAHTYLHTYMAWVQLDHPADTWLGASTAHGGYPIPKLNSSQAAPRPWFAQRRTTVTDRPPVTQEP
jgi:hypothetical protein